MRILVVEDDPAVSHSLALMLRPETCALDMTDLGEDVIELAKLNPYDLILLDLCLVAERSWDQVRWAIEGAPQAQERKVRDELTDRAQAA